MTERFDNGSIIKNDLPIFPAKEYDEKIEREKQQKLAEQRRIKYQSVFLRSDFGKFVLADIIEGICGMSLPAINQEIATKQSVAKEILCAAGIWFGEGQDSPEKFITKLASERS